MKKLLISLGLILGLGLFSAQPNYTRALAQEEEPTATVLSEEEPKEVVEEEIGKAQEIDEGAKNWLDEFLSPSNVLLVITMLGYISTIIGLAANIKKLRGTNNLTLKNVSDDVKKLIKDEVSKSVSVEFEKVTPLLLNGNEYLTKVLVEFANILALSQENTPESRVAILNIIKKLGMISQEIVDNSKNVVIETKKAMEEHKEEIDKQVDDIIEKYENNDNYDGTSI